VASCLMVEQLFNCAKSSVGSSPFRHNPFRTLHEAVLYEFGTEHEGHKAAGETILRATLSSGALLWNEIAVLQRPQDGDLRTSPRLLEIRRRFREPRAVHN
jgi:hypothetical protein